MRTVIDKTAPWPVPKKEFCHFYHSMDFPDGDSVKGVWDLRGRFAEYIGNYALRGKTVLDVGTASGHLAFCAEMAGATVVATDAKRSSDMTPLPFEGNLYHDGDRAVWDVGLEDHWRHARSGFWYAWHKYQSRVEMVYASLNELRYWDRRFDVVIAGAILEHLADRSRPSARSRGWRRRRSSLPSRQSRTPTSCCCGRSPTWPTRRRTGRGTRSRVGCASESSTTSGSRSRS